jgi:phage gp46-like protein
MPSGARERACKQEREHASTPASCVLDSMQTNRCKYIIKGERGWWGGGERERERRVGGRPRTSASRKTTVS